MKTVPSSSRLRALAVILIALISAPTYAADQLLAPLPKMTSAEAADTILPDGVICRITDTSPGDVRVGDGITAGGQPIGDGQGWEEGSTLTQDLNTGGHAINLGEGWSVSMLGGWGALSGPGELSTDGDGLNLSVYGSIMLSANSAISAAQLSISYDGTYLNLTTPISDTQPTIQYSPDLISQSWQAAPIASITTNATTYVFAIDPAEFGDYAFFRAVISAETGSTVTIHADTLAVPGTLTNPALDTALAEVATNASAINTNAASIAELAPTVALNSLATASNASAIASMAQSLTTQALIFHGTINGTNRTATLAWDFTNNVFTVEVTDD